MHHHKPRHVTRSQTIRVSFLFGLIEIEIEWIPSRVIALLASF